MTAMIAISFGVAVLLLLAACVKSDRVRGWRHSLNPSAPDLPDAAFVVGRVVFLIMAGVMVFEGFDLLRVSADSGWSDDELTSAVHQATDGLDGWMYRDDGLTTDSAYFDDYASLLEGKVIQYGGGEHPSPAWTPARPTRTRTPTRTSRCRRTARTRCSAHTSNAPGGRRTTTRRRASRAAREPSPSARISWW